jgi:hypothetical protein
MRVNGEVDSRWSSVRSGKQMNVMGLPQISRRAFHVGVLASGGAGLLLSGTVAGAREQSADDRVLGAGASLRGYQVFPRDNPWNEDVSSRPVDRLSQRILQRIGLDKPLHPDFGTVYQGNPSGISYVVAPGTQPKVPVKLEYADESDPGPYPIPRDAPIEGAGSPRATVMSW